jgi:hypothetical protein
VDRLVDFCAGIFVECCDAGIGGFLQLVQQFDREAGKVVIEDVIATRDIAAAWVGAVARLSGSV